MMLSARSVGFLFRRCPAHRPTTAFAAPARGFAAATAARSRRPPPANIAPTPLITSPPTAAKRFFTSSDAVLTKPLSSSSTATNTERRKNVALGVLGGIFLAGLHSATGSQNDFFDYRFTAEKSPEDLATFYGGEDFMELFCVFPFVGQLMMRNGYFDEKGNVITTGIPGTLRVSMVFSDDTKEETGEIEWFNKRERFRNVCLGWTCWDMVINFGFRTREDGSIEVYHYGEYFHGNLPVVSQIMMAVFKTHARWLAWATEHHVNHYAFTAETEEEEEFEDESRRNMPLFLLKNYAWSDLMAMLFGKEVDKPSFLLRKPKTSTGGDRSDVKMAQEERLPIQREATKFQISQDIATDRLTTKRMLTSNNASTQKTEAPQGIKSNAYGAATEAAHLRRLSRAATRRNIVVEGGAGVAAAASAASEQHDLLPIQQQATKLQISKDIASDRMRSKEMMANDSQQQQEGVNPQQQGIIKTSVYGAATGAARLRHLTRAVTRRNTGHDGGAPASE